MSKTELATPAELEDSPELLGERQVVAAEGWAKLYASDEHGGDSSAEIVLRNPAVYPNDVNLQRLPEGLQARWQSLLERADEVAARVAVEPADYPSASGLEKLQGRIFGGNIKPAPESRYAVAEIMITSSRLFAESLRYEPGNTGYYTGNARSAESWLERAKQKAY